ncbi:MAG: aldolase/citrate lyase family protein [Chloroflexota bacterium]|nr:aldolase/citrate lyase family protein [Chloroflexota bacterium]
MRGRELRRALAEGRRVYGIAIEGYGQPRWPRFLAQFGLDFVFIDSEHTPLNRETMAWAAQAYASNRVAPLLRIPEPSVSYAAMGLDLGAHGIIVPYVETVEQVKTMVGAVKYRPLKGAALRAVLENGHFPSPETAQYLHDFNPDSLLVIMIESPAGVRNLPEILAVGGVDAVLIGPHDFSVSHGLAEDYDHPLFNQAARQVIETCGAANVGVGIHFVAGDLEREKRWIEWGCNLIVHRSDTLFIAQGINQELRGLREELDGPSSIEASQALTGGHAL